MLHCNTYRLSDLVNGYWSRHFDGNLTEYVCHNWPSSIGCEYARTKRSICSIVRERTFQKPAATTLVVHLRLGDVLDWPYYRQHRRCNEQTGCYYVHPMSLYSKVPVPARVRHIELVGDENYRKTISGINSSLTYKHHVYRSFVNRNYSVSIRARHNADEDLVYMSNARFFLASKGGFSKLVETCAKEFGAELLLY